MHDASFRFVATSNGNDRTIRLPLPGQEARIANAFGYKFPNGRDPEIRGALKA